MVLLEENGRLKGLVEEFRSQLLVETDRRRRAEHELEIIRADIDDLAVISAKKYFPRESDEED